MTNKVNTNEQYEVQHARRCTYPYSTKLKKKKTNEIYSL